MGFKVLCLMGPTACGKTDLSVRLAQDLGGEIISVDSAMVYKGMDIGTAKPPSEARANVIHHLIDVTLPEHPYSAAKFRQDALVAIAAIRARGRVPILVGGTMLYFKALQQAFCFLPSADETVRLRLNEEAANIGWERMHARLVEIDPISAARIRSRDTQRIQRALEVYEITGQPLSVLWEGQTIDALPFECVNVAVVLERSELHRKIAERFLKMLQAGLLEEVVALRLNEKLHANLPAMRAVGYRQVWQYLEGALSYEDLSEKAIVATRQLAKRQLTWLRYWPNLTWFNSSDGQIYEKLLHFVRQTLAVSDRR